MVNDLKKPNFRVSVLLDEPYLSKFFAKLAKLGIVGTEDFKEYTSEDLFKLAPTSEGNRVRFMDHVNKGHIVLKR